MSSIIKDRLYALREYLATKNIQAFIVPSSDSHLSEYPANHWKSREWISGFTGSAGTVVVTQSAAGLWTDSRYFLQAEQELAGSGILLFKEGIAETPTIAEWLSEVLQSGETVGIDGRVYPAKSGLSLKNSLFQNGIKLDTQFDPFDAIWKERPSIPAFPVFGLPTELTGLKISEKIAQINSELDKIKANGLLVSSLDTIAWIFNLRGNDVEYNPVFVSYAYISSDETVLFINPLKADSEITSHLQQQGVRLAHYDKIFDYIASIKGKRICLQGDKTSYTLYQQVDANNQILDQTSPADLLKAQKNKTELDGFRRAMVRDGVALTRFFIWLENAVPKGEVTEHLISEKLIEFRSEQERFVGESFGTIAGFQENGAIVHYHADSIHSKPILNEGFLLIDSGGQYFDGTTDITRTVAMGELSEEMKQDYTNVLKGHIAIASAVFPEGTRGAQLDVLARQFLWRAGANYLHGTGHGIGHFLNVHEGPQNIRTEENPTTLKPGMVISNEPGVYRANKYGIRIENLITVESAFESELGKFLRFETLTLCPIDTAPIVSEMLSLSERRWLNNYHQQVFNLLSPHLNEDEKEWLNEKTKEII